MVSNSILLLVISWQ